MRYPPFVLFLCCLAAPVAAGAQQADWSAWSTIHGQQGQPCQVAYRTRVTQASPTDDGRREWRYEVRNSCNFKVKVTLNFSPNKEITYLDPGETSAGLGNWLYAYGISGASVDVLGGAAAGNSTALDLAVAGGRQILAEVTSFVADAVAQQRGWSATLVNASGLATSVSNFGMALNDARQRAEFLEVLLNRALGSPSEATARQIEEVMRGLRADVASLRTRQSQLSTSIARAEQQAADAKERERQERERVARQQEERRRTNEQVTGSAADAAGSVFSRSIRRDGERQEREVAAAEAEARTSARAFANDRSTARSAAEELRAVEARIQDLRDDYDFLQDGAEMDAAAVERAENDIARIRRNPPTGYGAEAALRALLSVSEEALRNARNAEATKRRRMSAIQSELRRLEQDASRLRAEVGRSQPSSPAGQGSLAPPIPMQAARNDTPAPARPVAPNGTTAAPRSAPIKSSPMDARGLAQEMARTRQEMTERGFRRMHEPFIGLVPHDGLVRTTFRLTPGERFTLIAAVCDFDCVDVNIAVMGPTGEVLGRSANSYDDRPMVTIQPRTAGDYTVLLYMASCATETCGSAIMAFGSR